MTSSPAGVRCPPGPAGSPPSVEAPAPPSPEGTAPPPRAAAAPPSGLPPRPASPLANGCAFAGFFGAPPSAKAAGASIKPVPASCASTGVVRPKQMMVTNSAMSARTKGKRGIRGSEGQSGHGWESSVQAAASLAQDRSRLKGQVSTTRCDAADLTFVQYRRYLCNHERRRALAQTRAAGHRRVDGPKAAGNLG